MEYAFLLSSPSARGRIGQLTTNLSSRNQPDGFKLSLRKYDGFSERIISLCYLFKPPTPEPEPELTEADLPEIQAAVRKLQEEYDKAVVVKHNLQNDVQSCSERLKAATALLKRYVDDT